MSFHRTTELLDTDTFRVWSILSTVLALFLVFWLGWLFLAEVDVIEVTDTARLESADSVHPVESAVQGRIVEVLALLEQPVEEGEILFRLESEEQAFEVEEARLRLATRHAEVELIQREMLSLEKRLGAETQHAERETLRARGKQAVEDTAAEYAEAELDQLQPLFKSGLMPRREQLHLEAAAAKHRAQAETERLNIDSIAAHLEAERQETAAMIAQLQREEATARGAIEDLTKHIEHLEHEVEEREIRAPVDGRIGWVGPPRVGSVVDAGQRLAEIVPASDVRAIASFPKSALGRLRTDQTATIRLDAFPWTQFGTVTARVHRIATETDEDERVRVELTDLSGSPKLKLEHGLTGLVEIEVERVSPWTLLLRAAGDSFRAQSI